MILGVSTILQAQSMRLIPISREGGNGTCYNQSGKKERSDCYILEYTPGATGVLTSYTTGFLVSCTSLGSSISKNQSCSMTSNSRIVDGCSSANAVLLNSSGHTGNIMLNKVEAGVPVLLHQICFSIPVGESITVVEDVVSDLTTSIDLGNGIYKTEFPDFEMLTLRRIKSDAAKPVALLDFQGIPAGDFISQLDWSTTEVESSDFEIERSIDGKVFEKIGKVPGGEESGRFNAYQFFDKDAKVGINYYRLKQIEADGQVSYSPVRPIAFELKPFAVNASPNPANEKLKIQIQQAKQSGTIVLLDALGKERMIRNFEYGQSELEVILSQIEPGTYTLRVKSGNDSHVEKIVIVH